MLCSFDADVAWRIASRRSSGSATSVETGTTISPILLPASPSSSSVRIEIGTPAYSDCSGSSPRASR